jgi:hypothetical protein
MKTLPHLIHLHRDEIQFEKMKSGRIGLPTRGIYQITKVDVSGGEFLAYVNKVMNWDVKLYYTPFERVLRGVFVIGVAVGLVWLVVRLVFLARERPVVIPVIGLIIHYISTSGLFYNILQGMSWAGRDQNGNFIFVMGSARGQYLGEGLSMSGLTVICGLSLLAAARLPYTDYAKRVDANKLTWILISLLLVSGISLYTVLSVYSVKVGWYQDPSFNPPAWYRTGPLRVDQGNTF